MMYSTVCMPFSGSHFWKSFVTQLLVEMLRFRSCTINLSATFLNSTRPSMALHIYFDLYECIRKQLFIFKPSIKST